MYNQMNTEQRELFEDIYSAVIMRVSLISVMTHSSLTIHKKRHTTWFFIEGKPGRGKTFLVNALAAALWMQQHIVLICGTSALAATLYARGQTAHYLFGIPVQEVRWSWTILNTMHTDNWSYSECLTATIEHCWTFCTCKFNTISFPHHLGWIANGASCSFRMCQWSVSDCEV